MNRTEALDATVDIARIDYRLSQAATDRQLSDIMRDVEARLEVECADAAIREAVAELAQRHRVRVYRAVLG